jgi:alpha-glucuronidase
MIKISAAGVSVMRGKKIDFFAGILAVVMLAAAAQACAQAAEESWLHYRQHTNKPEEAIRSVAPFSYVRLSEEAPWATPGSPPPSVLLSNDHALERTAQNELNTDLARLTGKGPPPVSAIEQWQGREIQVFDRKEFTGWFPKNEAPVLEPEGYWLGSVQTGTERTFVLVGGSGRGVLYGTFDLLRRLSQGQDLNSINVVEHPTYPIRWVDEWDNPDGSIERGYAGRSIFFEGGNVREDLKPVAEYARLLASVGINGCNVNNVNAAPQLLDSDHLKQLARVADAMRPWGVRLAMSVDVASPQKIGGLTTFDPLDPEVKAWWAAKVDEIYALIPDFAGFTVKADSEGQAGPASYGRTPADAANLLANALAPHHGVVLYRAFVYNHHLDWRDPKADRARAAYDIFHSLDGKFAANVIVQIKEGPIDFQAREPVSPLFAGLPKTSTALELEVTQEYTGQQRHLVYLAPMWKQVLDFDLRAGGGQTPVKKILARNGLGGMVAVAGVGRDAWLGSPLAMANLYAFGRLAWNPELKPEEIADEWIRQTISTDPEVVKTVGKMLMQSWPAYENYTGPLGAQTFTDITGSHYGPNIESSENNGWGQWHRADHDGIGMDRTAATGTDYAGQYPSEVAKLYESLATCPDELLLFFHHVPYTYRLHSGKTVIQHIYDSHYDGAAQAAEFLKEWAALKGRVDDKLYSDVLGRLEYQAGHAIVWRDAIVQYFYKLSGIADEKGRAGHYPGRLEAEDASLTGYKAIDVTPWEDASGGKAVSCSEKSCAAEWSYSGAAGRYNIAVEYFDLQGGAAKFTVKVNGRAIDEWSADAALPTKTPDGDNSTRRTIRGVDLKPGDLLRVEGAPDGDDPAALDYIELTPAAAF